MKRTSGQFIETRSDDETVNAFIPAPLPPKIDPTSYLESNKKAENSYQAI